MCDDPAQCPTTSPSTPRRALGKRLNDSPEVSRCASDAAGNCSPARAVSVAVPQGSELLEQDTAALERLRVWGQAQGVFGDCT